jgi:hypothetical protein
MDNDLEAIGTDPYELPMLAAAPANDDTELRCAPYPAVRPKSTLLTRIWQMQAASGARCMSDE